MREAISEVGLPGYERNLLKWTLSATQTSLPVSLTFLLTLWPNDHARRPNRWTVMVAEARRLLKGNSMWWLLLLVVQVMLAIQRTPLQHRWWSPHQRKHLSQQIKYQVGVVEKERVEWVKHWIAVSWIRLSVSFPSLLPIHLTCHIYPLRIWRLYCAVRVMEIQRRTN